MQNIDKTGAIMKKQIISIFSIIFIFTLTIYSCIMQDMKSVYAETGFDLTAKSALLLDFDSGSIIYEKEKDKKLPIASMVKLMTIYITLENIENGNLTLEQKITTTENASNMGGSQVFIDPYVNYSVEDLLKSVIMASANDASVALAEAISGSEHAFVDLMNSTAQKLEMNNTLYCNSTGLPAPEQYSTAFDCAKLLKEIVQFDLYHKYSNVWMDKLTHPSGRVTELVNTNKLIRYYDGCDSGKTGSTSEAGYCLSASAKKDNMRLVSIVIGAKTGSDRFKETTTLFNYGFANYQNKRLISKDVIVKELPTKRCKEKTAEIIPLEDYFAFDKKGKSSNYEVNYELPEFISNAKVGNIIGKAIISKDGNVIKIVDLTVKQDVLPLGFIDNFNNIISNW